MSETMPMPELPPEAPDPNIRPGEEGYIQDQAQAEVMAYASKGAEEAAVEANNAAAETMSHYGEGGRIDDWRVNRQANRQFNAAENARATADSQADAAAETYTRFSAATGNSAREGGPDTREQNAEKAEIMAYASKDKEEAAVEARKAGLEAAANKGDKKWRANQPEGQSEEADQPEQNLSVAERFKARAKKMGKETLRMAGLSQERSAKQETSHQLKVAEKAREAADKQATAAAKVYDKFDRPSAPASMDARRGELMDRAARGSEEMAANARELGLDAATRLGEGGLSGLAAKAEIAYHTKAFERSKTAAAKKAAAAAKAYDRANKFRTRDHYRPAA